MQQDKRAAFEAGLVGRYFTTYWHGLGALAFEPGRQGPKPIFASPGLEAF